MLLPLGYSRATTILQQLIFCLVHSIRTTERINTISIHLKCECFNLFINTLARIVGLYSSYMANKNNTTRVQSSLTCITTNRNSLQLPALEWLASRNYSTARPVLDQVARAAIRPPCKTYWSLQISRHHNISLRSNYSTLPHPLNFRPFQNSQLEL